VLATNKTGCAIYVSSRIRLQPIAEAEIFPVLDYQADLHELFFKINY
jgi:hypothetical protein